MSIVIKDDIVSGIISCNVPMQLSDIHLATTIGSLNELEDGKFVFVAKDIKGKYDDSFVEIAEDSDCLDFRYNKIDDERGLILFVGQDRTSNERFIVSKMIFNAPPLSESEQRELESDSRGTYGITYFYPKGDRFDVEKSVRQTIDSDKILLNGNNIWIPRKSDGGFYVIAANAPEGLKFIHEISDNEFLKLLGFKFIDFNLDGKTIKCEFTINGEIFVDDIDVNALRYPEKFFMNFLNNEISLNGKTCKEIFGSKYRQMVQTKGKNKYGGFNNYCLDFNFGLISFLEFNAHTMINFSNNKFLSALGFKFIEFNLEQNKIKCEFTINGETFVDDIDVRHFVSFESIVQFYSDFISNKISLNGKTCQEFLGDKYKPVLCLKNRSSKYYLDNNFGFGLLSPDCSYCEGVIPKDNAYGVLEQCTIFERAENISIDERKKQFRELGRYMRDVNSLSSDMDLIQSDVEDVTFEIEDDIIYVDKYGNCLSTRFECPYVLESFENSSNYFDREYAAHLRMTYGGQERKRDVIIYGNIAKQELIRKNILEIDDFSTSELLLIVNVLKDGLDRGKTGSFRR